MSRRAPFLIFVVAVCPLLGVSVADAAVRLATHGTANAKHVPVITSVTFTGSSGSPTVTVTGHGFRHLPPTGYPNNTTNCGPYTSNGDDYGTEFNFLDNTNAWEAGAGVPPAGNCIGLVVMSWKPHEVVFAFGNAYGSFDHWTADQSDSFTLTLKGAVFTGTVNYI
jgi:hypothetical protein